MGVLGGVFVLKSGLRILIRAPQVPFLVPPKRPFGVRERERFIPSHNIVKICSQNHCALQFVRLEEQHGHN